MRIKYLASILLLSIAVSACTNLERAMYNAENLAADTARGSGHAFNGWYQEVTNGADASALTKYDALRTRVHTDIKNFGATLKTADNFRLAYRANSANTNRLAAQAALDALTAQTGDIAAEVSAAIAGRPLPWPQTK